MSHKKRKRMSDVNNEEVDDTDIEDVNIDAVTDSEEEYTETERKLLAKVRKRRTSENFDSEDEVYALRDESEEEDDDNQYDSMESDIEELQEDYDIPDDRDWGKKTRNFYSSDYKYTDYTSATQKDFANAEMEEQEAKKLHTRSVHENFDIIDDRFMQSIEGSKDDGETVELRKLSNKHKQVLEQKESSVFAVLVADFKKHMMEIKEILVPFLELVENGTCPDCDAVVFIRTKYHVILNYCVNISFCLMLKAKGLAIHSHPVIKRLEQYRQLLSQLQLIQGDLLEQVAEIVKAVKEGKPVYSIFDGSLRSQKLSKEKISKLTNLSKKLAHQKEKAMQDERKQLLSDSVGIMDSLDEEEYTDKEVQDSEEKYDNEDKKDENNAVSADINEEEEKRAITYQIAKNRGLTPYRKKELRNPRVKHRNKYRKAKIRRKGAVREVRKELTRYAGEISGIKAGVIKSIKLK